MSTVELQDGDTFIIIRPSTDDDDWKIMSGTIGIENLEPEDRAFWFAVGAGAASIINEFPEAVINAGVRLMKEIEDGEDEGELVTYTPDEAPNNVLDLASMRPKGNA